MRLADQVEAVRTREDFVRFVAALREHLNAHGEDWENAGLAGYLEALGAWTGSLHHAYANAGQVLPEQPSWQLVARMLWAASMYE